VALVATALWAPPMPLRSAWYAARHPAPDTTVADRARRESLLHAAEWARQATVPGALVCVALVPWEDAVLFRFASLRSTTPLGTDAHALTTSNVRAFVRSYAFIVATRRAVTAHDSRAVERLARDAGADYLAVESSAFPWFRTAGPVVFTDGMTTVYSARQF
jgi:hypothetical protein